MKFEEALNRSKQSDLVFVSIGCRLDRKQHDLMTAQQLPTYAAFLADEGYRVSIILVSPTWDPIGKPLVVDTLQGRFQNADTNDTFIPQAHPNLTIRIVTDFFMPEAENYFVDYLQHKRVKHQHVIFGDFTITSPWSPLEIFPVIAKMFDRGMKYVYFADSRSDDTVLRQTRS